MPALFNQVLSWQNLRPELAGRADFSQSIDFFDLQSRARASIAQFLQNSDRTLLVLKADQQGEYAVLLEKYISKFQPQHLPLQGVRYHIEQGSEQLLPTITLQNATSLEDNFAAKKQVASAIYYDHQRLFGNVRENAQQIDLQSGLVHQLNGGVLILSVEPLLTQVGLWERLKQLLSEQHFHWQSLHPYKPLPCEIPSYDLALKVILLGDRTQLALLEELDENLYQLADYGEIESYFSLDDEQTQRQWQNYVQSYAKQLGIQLSIEGINRLYQLLVRESEDRHCINISPLKLKEMLSNTRTLAQSDELSAVQFEQYFQAKQQQQGFLQQQTYADILREQIYVATQGEAVGQINGLSVIEYPGSPISFGEPSRISCIVQLGEGEVIDVERKNELAGNIHSKGTMIAEVCLANILDLPTQLPFSASIVFEQSYSEIDGDSASLACFCVLASALALQPLPQSIAITGAIDQFGLVHSVGGVNQKIEGFFAICEKRGLTGNQGVIVPSAVLNQLSLSEQVINAVKNQQFSIWAVDDVFQACEILFKRHLLAEEDSTYNEQNQPLSELINQRLNAHSEQQKSGFWYWLLGRKN
ncbi:MULTISPECIES: Lon protease family protein [unclassified Avibacterium]|uniref:Lon protease family protein n=1 Tax=unclassified Avibacterium TaxID=2685287 RepID=UPI0022451D6F|nr:MULTISPECIES: Lon protease family protein [unclassified Avibacterium]MCW9698048.1 Lon protease family protein [Avibacterium sp. 20-129]MCW9718385.1 Lon protease family protein [Avibacterium sp. 21-599]